MVKEKRVNDGSKDGVIGYYCECGRCRYWGIDREKVEQIEKLHIKKVAIIHEMEIKLLEIAREEAKILGLPIIEVGSV